MWGPGTVELPPCPNRSTNQPQYEKGSHHEIAIGHSGGWSKMKGCCWSLELVAWDSKWFLLQG